MINNYIQNLPFNSTLVISQLNVALLGITGVMDAQFISGTGNGSSFTYEYVSDAGYMTLATPLAQTITYTAIQK